MTTELTTPWIVAISSAIVATLTSAVAFLFKLNESKSVKAVDTLELHVTVLGQRLERLDQANRECIEDRARLQTHCEIFEKRLSQLENVACVTHDCDLRKKVFEKKNGGE